MDIRALIDRIVRPLRNRIDNMVQRSVIRLVNDGTKCQTLQIEILKDEVRDGVEHFQPYGMNFKPPAGAEVIALAPTGMQDGVIAICATYRAHRPTDITDGEGGLYNSTGWKLFVNQSGTVNLAEKSAADFVALAAKTKTELDAIVAAFNSHNHGGPGPATPMPASGSVAASKVKAT